MITVVAVSLLLGSAVGLRKTKEASRIPDIDKELERVLGRTTITGPDNPTSSVRSPDYGVPTCHLSESECRLTDMTEPTLVYTDSDTSRCLNGDPWAFVVKPGRSDKLYWFFPGGGACFEARGPDGGIVEGCFPSLDIGLFATGFGSGAHDFENPDNYFSDYTFISAPYCSGGAHISNTTFTAEGVTYYQFGYNNNEFLRQWALKQVGAGIDPTLKSLVVMGSSAGSIGLAFWADTVLSSFKYEKGSVIFDSMMGIFPDGADGQLVQAIGGCNTPLVTPFRNECEQGTANIKLVIDRLLIKYTDVAFAHIHSKADGIQLLFYSIIGLNFGKFPVIPEALFYYFSNLLMQGYNRFPNYVAYVIDGDFHTFPTYPVEWYSTSIRGPNTTAPEGTPLLWDWVGKVINHESVTSYCNGNLSPNNYWYLSFCDEDVFNNKVLQV